MMSLKNTLPCTKHWEAYVPPYSQRTVNICFILRLNPATLTMGQVSLCCSDQRFVHHNVATERMWKHTSFCSWKIPLTRALFSFISLDVSLRSDSRDEKRESQFGHESRAVARIVLLTRSKWTRSLNHVLPGVRILRLNGAPTC